MVIALIVESVRVMLPEIEAGVVRLKEIPVEV